MQVNSSKNFMLNDNWPDGAKIWTISRENLSFILRFKSLYDTSTFLLSISYLKHRANKTFVVLFND